MSDFQSFLVFCGITAVIAIMFPSRTDRASKPIVSILKALPVNGLSKIAVAIINKTKN